MVIIPSSSASLSTTICADDQQLQQKYQQQQLASALATTAETARSSSSLLLASSPTTSFSSNSNSNSSNNTNHSSFSSSPSSPCPNHPHPLLLLNKFNFRHICLLAVLAPLVGIVGVFVLAILVHPLPELFAYEWSCGLTHLPSVSRVLNLPAGRILWNFAISFHFPLGLLIVFHYYFSFGPSRKRKKEQRNPKMPTELYLRIVFLCSGCADNLFLLCLSLLGERENGELHVICFSAFLLTTFIHFNMHFLLDDLISGGRNGRAKQVRMCCLATIWLLIPFITGCFMLHQLYCVRHSYELFAAGEYLTIVAIMAFNATILMDNNHWHCFYGIAITNTIRPNQKK